MKLLFTGLIFIIAACNAGQTPAISEDTLIIPDKTKGDEKLFDSWEKRTDTSNLHLSGAWTDGSNENASFYIKKDSIYYVDQFTSYRYSISSDSVKIYYSDWTFTGQIALFNDTLIITSSEDGATKYWKFIN